MLPQRLQLGTRRHMSQAQWATSLEMRWDGTLYILEPPAAAIALGQGAEGSGIAAGDSASQKMRLRETAVFDQILGFLRLALLLVCPCRHCRHWALGQLRVGGGGFQCAMLTHNRCQGSQDGVP